MLHRSVLFFEQLKIYFAFYFHIIFGCILGDPEDTAKLYCDFAYTYMLQYMFAVTFGSPSTI